MNSSSGAKLINVRAIDRRTLKVSAGCWDIRRRHSSRAGWRNALIAKAYGWSLANSGITDQPSRDKERSSYWWVRNLNTKSFAWSKLASADRFDCIIHSPWVYVYCWYYFTQLIQFGSPIVLHGIVLTRLYRELRSVRHLDQYVDVTRFLFNSSITASGRLTEAESISSIDNEHEITQSSPKIHSRLNIWRRDQHRFSPVCLMIGSVLASGYSWR